MSHVPLTVQPGRTLADHPPLQEGGGRVEGSHAEFPMNSRYVQPGDLHNEFGQPKTIYAGNVPPGLEYLTTLNHLLISQKVELLEAFTGFDTNNKYVILNEQGQQVYYAVEDTDFCTRLCLGYNRPSDAALDIGILDHARREVIHISRPLACKDCCFPCCLQTMDVMASGQPIGFIEQEWSLCKPRFRVLNAQREPVLKIQGPCMTCSLCRDVEFQVLSSDGQTQVGMIAKKWSGLAKEMFTNADNYGVQFPMDLSVDVKGTLLAATFLIDFMYFDHTQNNNN
ncbi:Phospholipid scramblase 2 [Hypsibius exemplaris]|uniref:Phospholipid scramblase n=1 Tax=Hypsibius exemplaris TaxID=2072580 RepID=A0A9X6NLH2_HYPEX|nr:Phospholipid scramblase 2 [Hypsibius exemplaris]